LAFFGLLKNTFVQFYEYLFKMVFLSIAWFFILLFPVMSIFSTDILVLQIVLGIFSLIIAGPLTLSGLNFVNRLTDREDMRFRELFSGIRKYFKKGLISFFFTLAIYLILFIDIRFFSSRAENWIMLIINIMMIYAAILFSMMMIHFWGLQVRGESRKFRDLLKYSFYLTLDNALVTALLLLFLVIFSVLMMLFVVAVPAVYFAIIALLIMNGTNYAWEELNRKIIEKANEKGE